MADLSISVDIDARGTRVGGATAKSEIKAVGDEAEKAGRKTSAASQDFDRMGKEAARAAGLVAQMSSALGLATVAAAAAIAALAAIVVAMAAVVAAAINLANQFSLLVIEVGNLSEAVGLTTETFVALKVEADAQGRSIDILKQSVASFTETIGEAAAGSAEARKKLAELGIDGRKAINDIDGAFTTAVSAIGRARDEMERGRLAFAAFGTSGYKLLPFLKEFNYDLAKVKQKAEELGVQLSGGNVAAAREFNRAYDGIKKAIKGVEFTFVKEFLPAITKVLKDFNIWLVENKDAIMSWAKWAGDWFTYVIDKAGLLAEKLAQLKRDGDEMHRMEMANQGIMMPTPYTGSPAGKPMSHTIEGNALPVSPQQVAAAMEAARAMGEKLREERMKAAQAELAAQVRMYADQIAEVEKMYDTTFKQIMDGVKETGNIAQFEESWQRLKEWYGANINDLATDWEALVQKQTLSEITGQQQVYEIYLETQRKKEALGQNTLNKEDEVQKALKSIRESAAKEELRILKETLDRKSEIWAARNQSDALQIQVDAQQGLATQLQVIVRQNALDLDTLNNRKKNLTAYVQALKIGSEEEKQIRYELLLLDNDITQQQLTNRSRLATENERLLQPYKDMIADLNSEYLDLTIQLQEYTTGIQMTRVEILKLTEAYKAMDPVQKKEAEALAARNDGLREALKAQEEYRRQYEETFNTIRDMLGVLADDGFGAFFKDIGRRFKNFLLDMAAQWLTSKFFELFYKGGNQKAAAGVGSGSGGGSFMDAISRIVGGGQGTGPGGTGVFNPGYFVPGGGTGSGTSGSNPWDFLNTGNLPGAPGSPSTQRSGGILSQIFGKGGIFGAKGFGANVGTFTGIGTIGAILGGAIGGRAGGFISNIGTGVALGAQIGSIIPGIGTVIGAAVGGVVGFFASLFGGNKQEKADKKDKMPQLAKGFTEALAQLRALAADRNALLRDPGGVLNKAMEIRTQIAGGFGIQFESRKYQRESQSQISQRLVEADAIIAEIKKLSEISYAAGDRDRRLLPEFAGGVYMSPAFMNFRRRNGMLGGAWTGRDTIPAMLAQGEAVLNPRQMHTIRSQAGFDVFKTAGIPGYAGGGMAGSQSMSNGPVVVQISMSQDAEGMWHATARSDSGRKVLLDVVSDGFANDEIKTRRR